MKLTRKLIPAMIMLLVSAVLMSTASFAWFSMNDTVSATGLTVTATAPASLWIQQGTDAAGDWAADGARLTTIELANENTTAESELTPVTPVASQTSAKAWAFQKLDADSAQRVDIEGKVSNPTYVSAPNDYYKDVFQLYLSSEAGSHAATTVKAEFIWANEAEAGDRDAADLIYKSLRVALVTEGGDPVVLQANALSPLTKSEDTPAVYTEAKNFVTLTADQAVTVYLYVWIEGTDENCMNVNAYNLDDFKINLVFDLGTVSKDA